MSSKSNSYPQMTLMNADEGKGMMLSMYGFIRFYLRPSASSVDKKGLKHG